MTEQLDHEDTYMMRAVSMARIALTRGEVPVGALVVDRDTGEVLSEEHNRTLELCDPSAHAEILALRRASLSKGNHRLTSCDLYVTLEPCTMCAGAASFARVRRVIIGALDPKGGAIVNGVRFFDQPTCHHRPEVVRHLKLADECGDILVKFFQSRRMKK